MKDNTRRPLQGLGEKQKVLRGLGLPEEMANLEAVQLSHGKKQATKHDCILSFVQNIRLLPSGCWLWVGCLANKDGYGTAKFLGKNWLAHRLSYLISKHDDPKDGHVCHHCDNPSCVNPDHIYLGNPKTNGRDKSNRNRVNAPHGEKHHRAKLTENQVIAIRELHRLHEATVPNLMKRYGMSCGAIEKIIYGQNWKHLLSGIRGVPKAPSPI